MSVIVGMDGGGTKTLCQMAHTNDKRHIGKEYVGGASNPQAVGMEKAVQTIASLLDETLKINHSAYAEISVLVVGVAGLGTKQERNLFSKNLQDYIFDFYYSEYLNICAVSDAVIALRAYIPPQTSGILLAAGTGSIAYGIDEEKQEWRSGGWGYLIGDEGSGYWLGKEALAAISAAHDGRAPATNLSAAILRNWKLSNPRDLAKAVYQSDDPRKKIASLAKVVAEQSEQGDEVASDILKGSARHLEKLITSVYEKSESFHQPVKVAFHGSILVHIPLIKKELEGNLSGNTFDISPILTGISPVEGALTIAYTLVHTNTK